MGTTWYPLRWSAEEERRHLPTQMSAFILPVTMRLHSPWHALHSLVPAFAQAVLEDAYGLRGNGQLKVILVDQDLDRDRHIWDAVLGRQKESIGPFSVFLRLFSSENFELLAEMA
eukprot:4806283-Amphidinium_carterae.1